MAAERLSMRTTHEILRLKWACGLTNRQIARSCGLARSTVADCLRRATAAGLPWPLPPDCDEAALGARLYPPPPPAGPARPQPAWADLHTELRRPGVTLQLLCVVGDVAA